MTNKQRSLLGGISILGIAGLICKIVGVLYTIPLANLIGSEGIGVYQQVFPTYNLMLTISSAGIPVAISRMVAYRLAKGHIRGSRRVFYTALIILTTLGFLSTLIMLLLSGQLAAATGTPESDMGFRYIAPSLLLVCVMSAFRGFMQGHRRMVPTAVSQLIEQVGKVGVALPLAYSFMRSGGYTMGVAGALLGTSIAEAVALLYMTADYFLMRSRLYQTGGNLLIENQPEGWRRIAREMVFSAVPITIGACIVPLAGAVDSFMLVRLMQVYLPQAEALSRYGIYSGLVIPLINVPTALAMAMASNLVPSISAKRAAGDNEGIRRDAASGLRLAMVIGLPSSIGMSLLAEPILFLLFGGGRYSTAQLQMGGQLLSISALTIVVFTLVQASSGILQGLYKQRIPMYTLMLGVILKVGINYTFVRSPSSSIFGAPWASLACYCVSAGLNIFYTVRYAKLRLNLQDLLMKPLLASLVMAAPVFVAARLLSAQLKTNWALMGLVMCGAVLVFIAAAIITGAIRRTDLPAWLRKG
jgi:stage V sporulation protein B